MVPGLFPRLPRTIRYGSQYTALVDILFATIGIFVIVFALQELETPPQLRPAPYDALVLCGPDQIIRLHRNGSPPAEFSARDVAGPLSAALEGGGRVLIGLAAQCTYGNESVMPADRLREMARTLSDRRLDGDARLNMFEFAPLGHAGYDEAALLERFSTGGQRGTE